MDIRKKQLAVVEALEDVKGRDILVFNVAKQTAYFERVVIASGDSNRQVNALATRVQERMKELGERIAGVEGRRNGEWVLVDLGDIVVHVMHPAVRSHYNLEELWGGKPVKLDYAICMPDKCVAEAPLSDQLIASLKKGNEVVFTSVNFQRAPNPIKMALTGFTGVFDGEPIEQSQLEERQLLLQEEMQKKAEDARKKLEEAQKAAKQN